MTAYDLLPYLRGHKPSGGGYLALCPCHPDKDPSLSINERDGKLLVHCFGCGAGLPDVLDTLGLPREAPADKPTGPMLIAEYFYGDQLKKCKYRKSDGSKYFVWYHREDNEWRKGRKGIDPGLYCNGDLYAALWSSISRRWQNVQDWMRRSVSTICATAMQSFPCVPVMISRLYRRIWVMPPQHSRWMFTDTSPRKCSRTVPTGCRNFMKI